MAESVELVETLHKNYDVVDKVLIEENSGTFDFEAQTANYNALAVCGGDGTFNSAINATRGSAIDLIYIPCGTLNDAAHTLNSIDVDELDDIENRKLRRVDLGEFNNTLFTYVAACGTFTPIGYLPKSKYKKVFKRLVYYFYAFKLYKTEKINASLLVKLDEEPEGKELHFSDTYTLIMALKSRYVFGFKFNKMYKHNCGKGHLLLIKSPKGLFKFLKLFLLFFRAFFIGFRKEKNGKYIKFMPFSSAKIELESPIDFCVDGERVESGHTNFVRFHKKRGKIWLA